MGTMVKSSTLVVVVQLGVQNVVTKIYEIELLY